MGYFSKSFYKQQQDQIREELGEELLELTLRYLPHLRPQKQQNDYWELIAIKLNETLALKRIGERHDTGPRQSLDEISTINGPRVKEIYEYEMKQYVPSFHPRPAGSSQGADIAIYGPRGRKERIIHELKSLQNHDVEIITEISKNKLRESWEQHLENDFKDTQTSEDDEQDEEPKNKAGSLLEKARESLKEKLIESLMDQIALRDRKVDKLTREVKKLLDLNHALVGGEREEIGER